MNGMFRYIKIIVNIFSEFYTCGFLFFLFDLLAPVLKLQNLSHFTSNIQGKVNHMHSIENEFYKIKNLENNNILTIDKKIKRKNQHFNLPSL